MKKILSFILCIILLASSLLGCESEPAEPTAEEKRAELYTNAVAALADDELTADGTYAMSADLITALENAEFTQPKNIIYMIGDGMGYNQLEAAEAKYSDKLYDGKMAWRYFTTASSQSTSSVSDLVTDSAAGGTALATGFRTTNGVIAMDEYAETNYKTVLELAAEKGKSTGVIATKSVTDATPASFTAHASFRSEEESIAAEQAGKVVDGTIDILLGGGSKYFEHNREDVVESMTGAGATYTSDLAVATDAELPIVGLFCEDDFDTTDPDMPTVAEMTYLALNKLSSDENGFFLMVEGSQIDSFGHSSELDGQTREAYQFDCAIAVALRFAAMNPDTVVIVTADHETGGLLIPAAPTKDNIDKESSYTSDGSHTQTNVPVLAIGYGTDALSGINHNTDCARFVASLLGEENFGQAKTVSILVDVDSPVSVTFSGDNTDYALSIDKFKTSPSNVKYACTIVVTVTNKGEKAVVPPSLYLKTNRFEETVDLPLSVIDPGETVVLTYPLPNDFWFKGRFSTLSDMILKYSDGTETVLEIGDIFVTERPTGK